MSNFQLRLLIGILLVIVTLAFIWLGGIFFSAFVFVIGGFILYEWLSISKRLGKNIDSFLAFLAYAASVLSFYFMTFLSIALVVLLSWSLLFIYGCVKKRLWSSFGFLYAVIPMMSLASLRLDPKNGMTVVLFLFTLVWASDVGGYVFGKLIGGKKIAPVLSPNKTISGSVGSFIFSGLLASLFGYLAYGGQINLPLIILALLLSAIVQSGDIMESAMKRHFGVKDSSNLLPGHGGFMDRFDGLIPACVVVSAAQHFVSLI